jgi:hypothetical protein
VLLAAAALVLGQPRPAFTLERVEVAATRATGTIRIDGRLDEPDWARATPLTGFRLIFVREGEAPSESTEVRVLFDDRRIFFGIRCGAHGAGAVRASLAPRDQILDDDFIAVHLDTYRDLHRAFMFGVNPYAVQIDGILDGGDVNLDWDGVWDAETTRDSTGWTAEIAVPLRTLRFPGQGPGVWGLWMRRQITRADEVCSFPLWRQAEQGDILLQAADLTGLAGLQGGGRLELQPYAASVSSSARGPTGAGGALSPWVTTNDFQGGADLKVGITSTMVANATVNPDYSQIEADALQIDVNQRYPLYYPEKRPFFLEGAETFTTPFDLVYTRRMANPAYGAKLVGKTGPSRLGVIFVRDDGGGSQDGIGAGGSDDPSRAGYFGVARATCDIGENSSLGALLTLHRTDARALTMPAALIPGAIESGGGNLVAAADAKLRLGRNLFFSGQLGSSATRADSVHFAGGPPVVNRFADVAYAAELRFADGTTELTAEENYLGPDFRAETGFLRQVDRRRSELEWNALLRPENAWLRSWQPIVRAFVLHDHTGGLQESYVSPMIDWKFQKQTHVHTMFERVHERWFDRFYDQNHYILDFDNTLLRAVALDLEGTVGEGIYYGETDPESYLGWLEEYAVTATVRPAPRFTAELSATRNRFSRSPWHSTVYDIRLLGAKCTYQFTRRLYARVYPQYDSGRQHLDTDALLGYVVHPGTVLYLGMSNGLDRIDGREQAVGRTYFIKASVLVQP